MNVTTSAKEFVEKYNIDDGNLDYELLKKIISDLGFIIIDFDPDNTRETERIFSSLSLDDYTKQQQCFLFKCNTVKYIFIVRSLTNSEKVPLLLHEIGHIVLNHPIEYNIISLKQSKYNTEANDFSCKVREFAAKKSKTTKALKISFASAFITAFIAIITLTTVTIFKSPDRSDNFVIDTSSSSSSSLSESKAANESKEDTTSHETDSKPETTTAKPAETKKPKTTTTTTTTTTTPSTTIPPETEQSYENIVGAEEVYYITRSGNRYHTEDCYYVSNRAKTAVPLSELEEMGYTPCSYCIK